LQVLGGFWAQVAGDDHLDGREQVADAGGGLHPATLDSKHSTAGRAGRDLQFDGVTAEGGHLDGAAEGCLGEGDGDVDAQVIAFPLEHRMLAHRDRNGEVSGRTAVDARLTLAAKADLLAVGDTSRDLHGQRLAAGALQFDRVAVDGADEVEGGGGGDVASLARAAVTAESTGRLA